jgi:hypothetical protein
VLRPLEEKAFKEVKEEFRVLVVAENILEMTTQESIDVEPLP